MNPKLVKFAFLFYFDKTKYYNYMRFKYIYKLYPYIIFKRGTHSAGSNFFLTQDKIWNLHLFFFKKVVHFFHNLTKNLKLLLTKYWQTL